MCVCDFVVCITQFSTPKLQNSTETMLQPQLLSSLKNHTGVVSSLAYLPQQKLLASGSWDKSIKLWHVNAQWGASEIVPPPHHKHKQEVYSTSRYL